MDGYQSPALVAMQLVIYGIKSTQVNPAQPNSIQLPAYCTLIAMEYAHQAGVQQFAAYLDLG